MSNNLKTLIVSISLALIAFLIFDSIFPRYEYYRVTITQTGPSPWKIKLTKEEYDALVGNSTPSSWFEKNKLINYYAIGVALASIALIYVINPFKMTSRSNSNTVS